MSLDSTKNIKSYFLRNTDNKMPPNKDKTAVSGEAKQTGEATPPEANIEANANASISPSALRKVVSEITTNISKVIDEKLWRFLNSYKSVVYFPRLEDVKCRSFISIDLFIDLRVEALEASVILFVLWARRRREGGGVLSSTHPPSSSSVDYLEKD